MVSEGLHQQGSEDQNQLGRSEGLLMGQSAPTETSRKSTTEPCKALCWRPAVLWLHVHHVWDRWEPGPQVPADQDVGSQLLSHFHQTEASTSTDDQNQPDP